MSTSQKGRQPNEPPLKKLRQSDDLATEQAISAQKHSSQGCLGSASKPAIEGGIELATRRYKDLQARLQEVFREYNLIWRISLQQSPIENQGPAKSRQWAIRHFTTLVKATLMEVLESEEPEQDTAPPRSSGSAEENPCLAAKKMPKTKADPLAFDIKCRGTPTDWHSQEVCDHVIVSGRKGFAKLRAMDLYRDRDYDGKYGVPASVKPIFDLLDRRLDHQGLPLSKKLCQPQEFKDGWVRCAFEPRLGKALYVDVPLDDAYINVAYHGTPIEALNSILFHECLFSSRDTEHGHRFLGGGIQLCTFTKSVYLHKKRPHKAYYKASYYSRHVDIAGDGMFINAVVECRVDTKHGVPVHRRDHWVQPPEHCQIYAFWFQCLNLSDAMKKPGQYSLQPIWNPLLEANPNSFTLDQASRSKQQEVARLLWMKMPSPKTTSVLQNQIALMQDVTQAIAENICWGRVVNELSALDSLCPSVREQQRRYLEAQIELSTAKEQGATAKMKRYADGKN